VGLLEPVVLALLVLEPELALQALETELALLAELAAEPLLALALLVDSGFVYPLFSFYLYWL
jgi:hypothetical protein